MRLLDIAAVPHPDGNRIDVSWTMPSTPAFPLVRVVRREGTLPVTPNPAGASDGVVVAEIDGEQRVVDTGLAGETVYYYGLFPYATTGPGGTVVVSDPAEQIDGFNTASALATAPLGLADEMYRLLPLVYHRFDGDDGPLRRWLQLPGGQLDQLHSVARALLGGLDVARVDGARLPLLAQWIGWNTDNRIALETQRNEIRHAPALYRAIGLIPAVEATVKRVSGADSRTKEFVDNVAATNRPWRLNLWTRVRTGATWGAAEPLSLDAAPDGRATAVRDAAGVLWLLYHAHEQPDRFAIWAKRFTNGAWTPSEPVVRGPGLAKHPTAALQAGRLVLFWGAYDRERGRWSIETSSRSTGPWSAAEPFVPPEGGPAIERRRPVAVADTTGGVWLFWLERAGERWVLKYNRHSGGNWTLNPSAVFPNDGTASPRVLDDVFALVHPADAAQRLWVFWTRQDAAAAAGQKRTTVAYRVKAGLDPAAADWSTIRTLPKGAGNDDHDCEPSALVGSGNAIDVYWSSHRDGRWSVWRSTLDKAAHTFGTPEDLGAAPHAQRAPTAFAAGSDTVLVFRSSASLRYRSSLYGATETVDGRYAGSLTLDTRNAGLLSLRGRFDDFGTYLHDTGRGNDDWYARDTIGVHVAAALDDRDISRVDRVLTEFMPVTDRAVFIKDS